ncbi:MetQ/NlpA family ABC transporter substrate-binding protein, partial [Escherichia coli]|nr:MetQ/NlpA family ABC transporter substrate-binding protein [Escherichia coli]
FVFPMAGYSRKIKSVADLKDGATIAIPNDPTNLGRALLLLQQCQLRLRRLRLHPRPELLPEPVRPAHPAQLRQHPRTGRRRKYS